MLRNLHKMLNVFSVKDSKKKTNLMFYFIEVLATVERETRAKIKSFLVIFVPS